MYYSVGHLFVLNKGSEPYTPSVIYLRLTLSPSRWGAQATARLGAQQLAEKPRDYQTGERPSVWFPATEVWEIRGADLTISPIHKVHITAPSPY